MNDKQRDQCAGINTKGANFCPVSPWRKDVIERFIFLGLHNPGEHNPGKTRAANPAQPSSLTLGRRFSQGPTLCRSWVSISTTAIRQIRPHRKVIVDPGTWTVKGGA